MAHVVADVSKQPNLLPGPQQYVKEWPKASQRSPKGHCFNSFAVQVDAGLTQALARQVLQRALSRARAGKRPGPPEVPKQWPNIPKIGNIGSKGSIRFGARLRVLSDWRYGAIVLGSR